VYGFSDELVRLSRTTGSLEHISSDFRNLKSLATVNGRLYWRDDDGVHEWREGATTRKTIVKMSFPESTVGSLVAYGDQVCWSVDTQEGSKVDCLDAMGTIDTWAQLPRGHAYLTTALVVANGQLFSAEDSSVSGKTCTVYELSNKVANQVAQSNDLCGNATSTTAGPGLLHLAQTEFWLPVQHRNVKVASSVSSVETLAGETYLYAADQLFVLDVKINKVSPIQLPAEPQCGDQHGLYGNRGDGKFVEFSPP
jgi:hypothetical protein